MQDPVARFGAERTVDEHETIDEPGDRIDRFRRKTLVGVAEDRDVRGARRRFVLRDTVLGKAFGNSIKALEARDNGSAT